jgi:tRNA-2-methylthio-N6-dimethylallyladenosine synthase
MNYADSARIKAVLTHAGFEYVQDIKQANLIIFDTCSVRQKSEDKITWKMIEIRPDQKVWMTGCMVQHHLKNSKIRKAETGKIAKMTSGNFVGGIRTIDPTIVWLEDFTQELKTISDFENVLYINQSFNPLRHTLHSQYPNIELFFRIDDTGFLPLLASKLGYDVHIDDNLTNEYSSIIPHNSNQQFTENTKTAYVPISTWCSQFCSYCIVPYARGLENNRPIDEILTEVKFHLDQGVQEIVLLGQIVNKHPDFVGICKEVLKLKGLKRLRYTSPYPTYFPKELLELHENEEAMCPHIHMPLQSGSDTILKKMFRGYNSDQYKQFVDNIRGLKRPISITSDIIVWHPDESVEDFQASLAMTEYAKFDMVYIGIYSTRPGTIGAKKYLDNISKVEKKRRWTELNNLLIKISSENNEHEIWRTREVMISRKLKDGKYFGYTDNMKNIIIEPGSLLPVTSYQWDIVGQFSKVTIIWSEAFKLFG